MDDQAESTEVIVVESAPNASTAVDKSLAASDLAAMPSRSADDLLRALPGMMLSAHGGRGKSFQFLVRGFDAEHGTDLAVTLDGVPINEACNVHGQGYLDLAFVPTVLVRRLDLTKGSYRARDGDFAITGAADYYAGLDEPGLTATLTAGSDLGGGASVAWRPANAGGSNFVVTEGEGARGVGEGRAYAQGRLALGAARHAGPVELRAMAFAYDGVFESPGVLREDDLAADRLGFYDAYPMGADGESQRALALVDLRAKRPRYELSALVYGGVRALRLDQNFTGYLVDAVHGDGQRQSEQAAQTGVRFDGAHVFDVSSARVTARLGADGRFDAVALREEAITIAGDAWEERADADLRHADGTLWTEARLDVGPVTLVPSVRGDLVALGLRSRRDEGYARVDEPTWEESHALVLSPRVSAALGLGAHVRTFAAYGQGFRSPDARGIQNGDLAPIVKTDSAEVGATLDASKRLALGATAFYIGLDDELIFDHLTGRFLSAGRTRRLGIEGVATAEATDWLTAEVDVAFTDARFVASDEPIAYAPRVLVTGAVAVHRASVAGGALSGGLRTALLGPRPLPSGFASHPSIAGALTSELRWKHASVGLDVDNAFFSHVRDGEFVYPSWFDVSTPRSERKVLHVTAGDPFAARITVGWRA